MLRKFMDIFFEEVIVEEENDKEEVKEEIIVKQETIQQTTTPIVDGKDESKKSTYITIDDGFNTLVSEPEEKIKIPQSAFVQNGMKTLPLKQYSGKTVEYEFTPVLSPMFGVVGAERKKIKVSPDYKKTEIIQPKESILGAGIRPYSGIIENDDVKFNIPFDIKNGSKKEEDRRIDKIDISDIVKPKTRMSRHGNEENNVKKDEIAEENSNTFDFIKTDQYDNTQNDSSEYEYDNYINPEPMNEYDSYITPNPVEEYDQHQDFNNYEFDESSIVVKEKPTFFNRQTNESINHIDEMQTLEDENGLSFEEEEEMNLFNMDL